MDYWTTLTRLVTKYHSDVAVATQFEAMAATRLALAKGQLPEAGLPMLGLNLDQTLALLAVPQANLREINQLNHLLHNFRYFVAYHYGMWAFVHQALFSRWQTLFGPKRYLEVAAGNGYLSLGLSQVGNQVITTDSLTWQQENVTGRSPLVPVTAMGANEALFRYADQVDAVVMAWSPDKDPNDVHFLHLLRTRWPDLAFFLIGERFGATNSRLFWQQAHVASDRRLLALNQQFKSFDQVHDRIYLIH
ncbi:hypothetical protein [Lacticaseibacillus brantae]|uniref:SAM-dependent methyltransferase n=1 Tax=Lacticaseibacillus brantae DSM 23927 TaxID=1423727 RepID=A0A0R2AZH0_9LACO|nr:hypothetical protein [Lacticaseibacillus brantae]KRM72686.1 SAM-dependent methyltransferase [Lacticaseibacillus brantae DSM 23927]